MDAWWQCEIPYPFVPQEVLDAADSVRGSLPNRYCDPRVAADLFEEVLDEFLLCDELGLNVLAIEHHAGINSLMGANPMLVGILARQTRKARILSLGTLVSLRHDPVRIAEEYATADVISRGRLEIGFVKSGGSEMASANANPVGNVERYWEAIDLIRKALSHAGRAVQLGGQAFHPSPRQHLAAAVAAAASPHVVRRPAIPRPPPRSGGAAWCTCWCCAAPKAPKRAYQAHRQARAEAGLPKVTTDNFAYAALVYVGDTEEEGVRVGSKLLWFLNTSLKSAPQYSRFLPGIDAAANSRRRSIAPQPRRDAPPATWPMPRRASRPPAQNAQQPDVDHARGGDGAGHPVRRQSRQRLSPDHGILRQGRRLRPPGDDRPLRLHDARRKREGHPPVRQGGPAAPQRDQADGGGVTRTVRPPRTAA